VEPFTHGLKTPGEVGVSLEDPEQRRRLEVGIGVDPSE